MATLKYNIRSIDCANCASKIEKAVSKIKGIQEANLNFITQNLTINLEDFASNSMAKNADNFAENIVEKNMVDSATANNITENIAKTVRKFAPSAVVRRTL